MGPVPLPPLLDTWGTSAAWCQITIHRPCWSLSIALACQEPVQTKATGRPDKEQARFNNRAVARCHPSPIAQVRNKEDEQQHRFLSFITLVTALLATRQNVLFYLCKTNANSNSLHIFLGLACVIWGQGHPSCARRRTNSRCVYALRGLDAIYQVTVCALRGSDVIYQRHASLRPTRFRRHLSARPPAYAFRRRRHLSGQFRYTSFLHQGHLSRGLGPRLGVH